MDPLIHDKKIFSDCFLQMQKRKWTCMSPDCKCNAIKSHVLQKNGVLSHIAKDDHLIEVKPTNIWEIDQMGIFKYQEIGINDGFTFPGFCKTHDDQIFSSIEKETFDIEDYFVQCLFSYRGLCQELRRKQQVKYFLENVLERRASFKVMNVDEIFDDYVLGLGYGINNLNFFKQELEKDLLKRTKSFSLQTIRIPFVGICTSAPLNIKEPDEKEPETIEEYEKIAQHILPTTFLSIFPTESDSILITGHHQNYPSSYTSIIKSVDYRELISDLLILRMEYWCMSHEFLTDRIKPKEQEIKNLFMQNALNFGYEIENRINLFEN
jgi:hypothetical protein